MAGVSTGSLTITTASVSGEDAGRWECFRRDAENGGRDDRAPQHNGIAPAGIFAWRALAPRSGEKERESGTT